MNEDDFEKAKRTSERYTREIDRKTMVEMPDSPGWYKAERRVKGDGKLPGKKDKIGLGACR